MNIILIFHSIYHSIESSRQEESSQANSIGVKDLRIVKVVQKIWGDNTGSYSYNCELTFKDGIRASCELTGKQINDLYNTEGFSRQILVGISSTERCFNQICDVKQRFAVDYNAFIGKLHKGALKF